MTVTSNDRGQQNLWAKEPRMYVDPVAAERYGYETHAEKAEKLNGRTAMIGFRVRNVLLRHHWQPLLRPRLKSLTFINSKDHERKTQNASTDSQPCSALSPPWVLMQSTGQVIPGIW